MSALNRVDDCLRTVALFIGLCSLLHGQQDDGNLRRTEPLLENWRTFAVEDPATAPAGIHLPEFDDRQWAEVRIPHNWDRYEGFRQAKHGNFHGTAWYRTSFGLRAEDAGRRVFLFFEGVGSYATVWVNGEPAGTHAGGLTSFTLDVTQLTRTGNNSLVVRADHPAGIRDLPWVCGGCELAYGFSEGTQPFGISRPVSLIVTHPLRITPFGVHAWNDTSISAASARLHLSTEVRNHGNRTESFVLRTTLIDPGGHERFAIEEVRRVEPGQSIEIGQTSPEVSDPALWSPARPQLHTIRSELLVNGTCVDRVTTAYGIRWIEWPDLDGPPDQPLLINGEPFFVNGVADYEHMLGESHAFTDAAVVARARQIKAAGFNAFRDAHHPHNLRFNAFWDNEGLLWWTQFGAHIWFENEAFQNTYKSLLREWVRERRNSPSLFLYGLQNESKLPPWFVEECLAIIREMDPTASTQRLVTTCNGGSGTDWDVPQNWSGTYGGDLFAYDRELRQQRLVGEYGAWRSLDLHSEGGFIEEGVLSEDRMGALMETKVRLAESVRDKVIGHFMWPFVTHQNPGRNVGSEGQQTRDGVRLLDRVGPANNKGLLTLWGEPLDVYYMYRSHYIGPASDPMVFIVSHTWPDRWLEPGRKDGIIVYSNCEEVELFNDRGGQSLGTRRKAGRGSPLRWDDVPVQYNVLYAEGRVDGKVVATDMIRLHHLPEAPLQAAHESREPSLTLPIEGHHYLYRVNAGGPDQLDVHGNLWQADRAYREGASWGSLSWDRSYSNLPDFFASKRRIYDPIEGSGDDRLFQSFRFGRDQLGYRFALPNGDYWVELYFMEPWYGTGGGMDCTGWRQFDVAINGRTVIEDLDIWSEVGRARVLRKVVKAAVENGWLKIDFPDVQVGQAVVSAIAISTPEALSAPPGAEPSLIQNLRTGGRAIFAKRSWLDTGDLRTTDTEDTFSWIPWSLREAEWIQVPSLVEGPPADPLITFTLARDASVHVAYPNGAVLPEWLKSWSRTGTHLETRAHPDKGFVLYTRHVPSGEMVRLGTPHADASAMYSIIVTERKAPPPPNGLIDFSVRAAKGTWQPAGHLKQGSAFFADDSSPIAAFSSRFSDADWIRTAREDAANGDLAVRFKAKYPVEVFVLFDPEVERFPRWVADWMASDWHVSVDQPRQKRYQGRWRRFAPDEWIHLGPNGFGANGSAGMYGVVVRTVKPERRYEIEEVEVYAPLLRTEIKGWTGRGYLDLEGLKGTRFEAVIEVGVGDRYTFRTRYQTMTAGEIPARISVVAADGSILCEELVAFPPTVSEDWAELRYRTCDSINAGTYRFVIESNALDGLLLDSLTVE